MSLLPQQPSPKTKPPRAVFLNEISSEDSLLMDFAQESIFAFPPNRDTLGGTSYLIVRNESNILIDCPTLDQTNQDFLAASGGVDWLFLTHRGAIGKTAEIQQIFGCKVLIQEQEAYLLPGLTVTSFSKEFTIDAETQAIWTPGHSPGSSCLYYSKLGGILFSGRHLLPNQHGQAVPLRTAKTFHWPRQINSLRWLLERFTPESLEYICPGANTGFLRGKRVIDRAYQHLASLDLPALLELQPVL
ncbi:MAG: MBL fold metallo-hydrolase [Nostoc sp. CreGUA01]|nr:MBL fold metallo-hydrolase [Nostoc sp. CreGUA01]